MSDNLLSINSEGVIQEVYEFIKDGRKNSNEEEELEEIVNKNYSLTENSENRKNSLKNKKNNHTRLYKINNKKKKLFEKSQTINEKKKKDSYSDCPIDSDRVILKRSLTNTVNPLNFLSPTKKKRNLIKDENDRWSFHTMETTLSDPHMRHFNTILEDKRNNYLFITKLKSNMIYLWKVLKKKKFLELKDLALVPEEDDIKVILYDFLVEIIKNKQKKKLYSILIKIFRLRILKISFFCLGIISAEISYIIFLDKLLKNFNAKSLIVNIFWGGMLGTSLFFHFIFQMYFLYWSKKTSIQLRLILIKIIFKKINSLSSSSLKNTNFGKLLNIITNGLNTIEEKFSYFFYLILFPFSLSFSIIVIFYMTLSTSSIIGTTILLLLLPIRFAVLKKIAKRIKTKNFYGDNRLKNTQFVIENSINIKLNCSQEIYYQYILDFRNKEVKFLKKMFFLDYFKKIFEQNSQIFAICFTLIAFNYLGDEINVVTIFSFFQVLSFTKNYIILNFSVGLKFCFEAYLVCNRIEEVLDLKEIKKNQYKNNRNLDSIFNAIVFDNYSSSWSPQDIILQKACIKNVNITIKKEKKYLLIG